MSVLKVSLLVLAVLVGLYLLDRAGLWAQRLGWLFWRSTKPTGWPA